MYASPKILYGKDYYIAFSPPLLTLCTNDGSNFVINFGNDFTTKLRDHLRNVGFGLAQLATDDKLHALQRALYLTRRTNGRAGSSRQNGRLGNHTVTLHVFIFLPAS